MEESTLDFDGVFRGTNWTDEDFVTLWNNKEYIFPAKKTVPIIIGDETNENIQEIRKRWAYQLATREFYKGKEYIKMSKMGNGIPPTFDEKILEPMIQRFLEPLPIDKITVRGRPKDSEKNYKGSKAITDKDNPNFIFREESANARTVGEMPNK